MSLIRIFRYKNPHSTLSSVANCRFIINQSIVYYSPKVRQCGIKYMLSVPNVRLFSSGLGSKDKDAMAVSDFDELNKKQTQNRWLMAIPALGAHICIG